MNSAIGFSRERSLATRGELAGTMVAAIAISVFGAYGCGEGGGGEEGAADTAQVPAEPAGTPGTATVSIGETVYQFNIHCMFGTTGVQGAGTSADGTAAYLVANFDPEDPESADVDIRVGTDSFGGPAEQIWVAGPNRGTSALLTWEGDSQAVRGAAPFRDRRQKEAPEGKASEVTGQIEVSCPEG